MRACIGQGVLPETYCTNLFFVDMLVDRLHNVTLDLIIFSNCESSNSVLQGGHC